jgi:DnaK suppressor protein
MTPELLPRYAQQLHALRTDLLAQLRQQRGGEVSRADAAADSRDLAQGDWAQADAQRDLSVALQERELHELNQIDAALARISEGDYGACTDCGADIPDARLQANPVAERCIGCQTKFESTHGALHTHSL